MQTFLAREATRTFARIRALARSPVSDSSTSGNLDGRTGASSAQNGGGARERIMHSRRYIASSVRRFLRGISRRKRFGRTRCQPTTATLCKRLGSSMLTDSRGTYVRNHSGSSTHHAKTRTSAWADNAPRATLAMSHRGFEYLFARHKFGGRQNEMQLCASSHRTNILIHIVFILLFRLSSSKSPSSSSPVIPSNHQRKSRLACRRIVVLAVARTLAPRRLLIAVTYWSALK